MRDLDIREELHARLRAEYAAESETLILDELGVCEGAVRVDVAVVNGSLIGYEIKSEVDSLDRLANQEAGYSRVFDKVIIVTASRHVEATLNQVPDWWGVLQARANGSRIELQTVREAQVNPDVDPFAMAQLLWRDEALEILELHGVAAGVRSKPRACLWRRLTETLPPEDLAQCIRYYLKKRQTWRSGRRQTPGDDSSLPAAKS